VSNIHDLKAFIEHKAYQIRLSSLIMTTMAGSGHPTSCLSAADIVATLFFYGMHFDPDNFENNNNDRFILSKGHASPVLYAVWQELGKLSWDELMTYRKIDSVLEGHPTRRFEYTECATGSLGIGLSIGAGMALNAKMDHRDYRTFVLLGDGEIAEGCVWEAAEIADHYKLGNLIGIVDCNRLEQSSEVLHGHHVQRYADKFHAFGFKTIIVDGHDVQQLMGAIDKAREHVDGPTMILAKTFKGHGVNLFEDKEGFHGKVLSKEQLNVAIAQLEKNFKQAHDYKSDFVWEPNLPSLSDLPAEPIVLRQAQDARLVMSEYGVSPVRPVCPSKPWRSREFIEGWHTGDSASNNELVLDDPKYKLGDMLATRKAYGQAITAAGTVCKEIISLDAEVKNSTYAEIFEQKFPERFVQCYIAEQNMVSMAVGFERRGKIPFVSTFAAFFSRAYDQLRMAAIGKARLRLAGSHAGVSIGQDGPSQMGLEDIALICALPESIVLYPSDAVSAYKLIVAMANYHDGISYLRTTRAETPIMYENYEEFVIGGCKVVRQSENDVACIVAAGITLHEALKAYDILREQNISVSVIDLYSIKPLDANTLKSVAAKSGNTIITVEDHYLQGGIGQIVSYALRNSGIKIECLAVTELPRSGKPEELLAWAGIDAQAIVKKINML